VFVNNFNDVDGACDLMDSKRKSGLRLVRTTIRMRHWSWRIFRCKFPD
jgi:hypothetical protein